MNNIKIKELSDRTSSGREIDWRGKKLKTEIIAGSYQRLLNDKFYRIKECSTFLEFKRFHDDTLKLNKANFCKVRLCPLCSWRRSLKIYGQVSKVMDKMEIDNESIYLFLTLTCRNVPGTELIETMDQLFNGFKLLAQKKVFKKAIKGYFRALEITHNKDNHSIYYNTYHPHFHVILAVSKNYFKKPELYINQSEWVELWKDSLKIDYLPIVDVRRFKGENTTELQKSVAEAAKYTIKDSDLIIEDNQGQVDEKETDKVVEVLDAALAYRRLIAFGGIMKKIHRELNLDDALDGDLINTDNEELRNDLNYVIERYQWNIGYKQYLKIEI